MSGYSIEALIGYAAVVFVASRWRGRRIAQFMAVIFGVFTLVAIVMRPQLAMFGYAPEYLHACVCLNFVAFLWPRLRPWWWRMLVALPGSYFAAATLLSLLVTPFVAFGVHSAWLLLPYAVALLGLFESLITFESVRTLVLDAQDAGGLRRYPLGKANGHPELSIVQITDPHLGPFMSVAKLSRICERAVARNPDLIFLTGDFLTIETNREPDALARALAPLSAARGKVFACLGNHDHEALDVVRNALAMHGVTLLVDEACEIDARVGRLQIVGMDFHYRDRRENIARVFERHLKPKDAMRIVLLHDPGAFFHVPDGEADLVLSGHTHGGQLGLLSFGLPYTFLSAFTKIPDHGFWARGRNRLYVHRGTGHYGFPLRIGVPAEQSMLRVQRG